MMKQASDLEPGAPRARRQRQATGVLYALLTLLALWVVHDFLPAIAWAAVVAIALWPALERLESWGPLRGRNRLVSALLTLLVGVVFVVPLSLAVAQAAGEAHTVFDQVHQIEQQGIATPPWMERVPGVGHSLSAWWQANLANPGGAATLAQRLPRATLLEYGKAAGARIAHGALTFGFMLLVLFFVFAAGSRLRDQLLGATRRAFGSDGASLAVRMANSVRGTVSGLVLVGCGEGALLGVGYAIAGVPHAALLGGLTAVAAMLPFCAPVLFSLAALYLLAQGATAAAICVFATGVVVVGVAEHFVRPVLIGGSARLPFLLVLFGILGGAETLGLLGLFIGPALMTILMVLWQEWARGELPA